MTDIELEKLKKLIDSQLEINEDNLQESIQKTCIRKQTYQSILLRETKELVNKTQDLDILYSKLYHQYKFESSYNYTGKEIEGMISGDATYSKLVKEINTQKALINFLEKTIDNFTSLSFQIKNLIEWKKFQAGY